jgi:hypothetical protein
MATSTDPEPCLPVGIPGLIPTGRFARAVLFAHDERCYHLYVYGEWVYSTTNHDDVYRLVTQPETKK